MQRGRPCIETLLLATSLIHLFRMGGASKALQLYLRAKWSCMVAASGIVHEKEFVNTFNASTYVCHKYYACSGSITQDNGVV